MFYFDVCMCIYIWDPHDNLGAMLGIITRELDLGAGSVY